MRWSIITVTHNSVADLRTYWRTPRPPDVEWIVVDNASTDESVAAAALLGARVIRLERNVGFSTANNRALAQARGPYVLFANPDLQVDYGALPLLEQAADQFGALTAPQLLNPDGTVQPNGRRLPTLQNKVANRLGHRHDRYFVTAAADEMRYVCWAIGAAVAGRRSAFECLGGWNEAYFLYYEDSDLCLRAWDAGMPVLLHGGVRWIHGWKRATTRPALAPWRAELRSMARFYAQQPALLAGERVGRRAVPRAAALMGQVVAAAPVAAPPVREPARR